MKLIYTLTASAALMMAYGTANANPNANPAACKIGNASFCQPVTPRPEPEAGPRGFSGSDGKDGQNGRDALSAIATLQTRTPIAGQWTGAFGLTGSHSVDGAALGVRYGLSDRSDVYAIVGHSRDGVTTWAAGVTWTFGGVK